jgi:cytoskeletal protein CcmA (bactofilin family)
MRILVAGSLLILMLGLIGAVTADSYSDVDNPRIPSADGSFIDVGGWSNFTGELTVTEDFTFQASESIGVTFYQGSQVTVKIEESKFVEASLNLTVLAEVQIKGQWLKLKGTINGKIDASYDVDFTGELTVEEDFVYQASDSIKTTLYNGGKTTVKVEQSKFKWATLNLTILADIKIKGQILNLKGPVTGKIDETGEVDFIGKITVKEDFVYPASDRVKVTLFRGGRATVKVEKSKFVEATLNLTVAADIQIDGQTLTLEGTVTGKVHDDYDIDFNGTLTLKEPFTYNRSRKVKLTFVKGDKLTIKVKQSKFNEATFGLTVSVDISINGSVLKLKGPVTGKIDEDHEVDLTGELTVEEDFRYQASDSLNVTLSKGGKTTVKVEQSKFKEATLNLTILADVTIKDQWLKLNGTVSGKIQPSYGVDFTGELSVEEDFVYQASDNVKVTLFKGGKTTVKVEQSKFKEATLDLTVLAEITIKDSVLKLKGSVTGKIDDKYDVDINGSIEVEEDFTYKPTGRVKITLVEGEKVTVKVEKSKFKEATLNLTILTEIQIKGQWLKLKGSVSGKINSAYKVDFTGTLTVEEDFTYKPSGRVKLTLVKGGKLTAKVEKSKFKEVTLNLTILAEIKIKGQWLKLNGSISGKYNETFEDDLTDNSTRRKDLQPAPGRWRRSEVMSSRRP